MSISKHRLKSLVFLPVYCLLLLLTPSPAFAAINIVNDIPNAPFNAFANPGALISTLLSNAFILAGLVMFIIIFFGGFMIISGAAGGDAKKSQQGTQAATWAVVGFLVIFASYWILQIVKVITGIDVLKSQF